MEWLGSSSPRLSFGFAERKLNCLGSIVFNPKRPDRSMDAIWRRAVAVPLALLFFSIKSFAIDGAACLGRGIYLFQSAMNFTVAKYEERGTQYPAYALKELSSPDHR